MRTTALIRKTPLRPGTVRLKTTSRLERGSRIKPRKTPRKLPANSFKAEMVTRWNEADLERAKALHAARWGCEYSDWLQARFEKLGCELCGSHAGPCHRHHVKTRKTMGTAEHLVPLCAHCHVRGHAEGFSVLEQAFGLKLRERAALLASHGRELQLLTLEQCEVCRTWHSLRYMVDLVEGAVTRRACTITCAPEGPQ